ncbi:MAG: chromosome segregation protein SMC, partial [Deltaproteobacteria bacterium]|nr:chromosome segregation protein SMC [Deltaproteobacteria bacterium]
GQRGDLEASVDRLERLIQKVNRTTRERFLETFNRVNEKFEALFPRLFNGGKAKLLLTDENNLLETGVEIVAQPPGKKLQSVGLLSGGEKALTAVSLIFSIFQFKPSPFCILDEVDAPLDDANVERYNDLIRDMTARTQFIVITHNKKTMQMTDVLYGVTMQEPGASQLVSVEMS